MAMRIFYTTTDCGANLYDIAKSALEGKVYAVIYTDVGEFVGTFNLPQ